MTYGLMTIRCGFIGMDKMENRRCFCTSNFEDWECGCVWEWLGKNSEKKDKFIVKLCDNHKEKYQRWVENCKSPELKKYPNIPIYNSIEEIVSRLCNGAEVELIE